MLKCRRQNGAIGLQPLIRDIAKTSSSDQGNQTLQANCEAVKTAQQVPWSGRRHPVCGKHSRHVAASLNRSIARLDFRRPEGSLLSGKFL